MFSFLQHSRATHSPSRSKVRWRSWRDGHRHGSICRAWTPPPPMHAPRPARRCTAKLNLSSAHGSPARISKPRRRDGVCKLCRRRRSGAQMAGLCPQDLPDRLHCVWASCSFFAFPHAFSYGFFRILTPCLTSGTKRERKDGR